MSEGRAGPATLEVHIVDDDEPFRRATAMLLRSAGLSVTTHLSAQDFLDALTAEGEAGIGCVLTDVRMPGLNGLEMLRHLRGRGFRRPVVVMTAHGDVATAVRAMKLGAMDFIEKPFDEKPLLELVQAAFETPTGAARDASAAADAMQRVATLTPRERQVLDLLTAGNANKAVAHELGLSPRTVEIHRARMLERLGVRSLAEAVRLAVRAEMAGPAGEGQDAGPTG